MISLPISDGLVSFLFCKPGVFGKSKLEERDGCDLAACKVDIALTAVD